MSDRRKRPRPPIDPLIVEREDAEHDGYAWQHYGRDAVPDDSESAPAAVRRRGRRANSSVDGEVV